MRAPFLELLGETRIYPITDRLLSQLSHAEQLAHLASSGFKIVQLREKSLAAYDFYRQAEEAMQVARANGVRVIINDRVDIALAVKADGVHLGQEDLAVVDARRLLGESAIIGFSTHSSEQAQQAKDLPIDYLAIGPIFPTSTKENPDPLVGLDELATVRRILPRIPLVAIGGINSTNRRAVFGAGADAVAVVSEIWK